MLLFRNVRPWAAGSISAALSAVVALADTPSFQSGVKVGTNQSASITECSGMAASRRNPHVLWVHNDSGDSARLYAINTEGKLHATCNLTGASASDWEDMALCTDPSNGVDYLYAGDIGDNSGVKSSIRVYRVPEPDVDTNQFNITTNLSGVETYTFTYPDGARDAETLLVDPWNGDIIIVSKRETYNGAYRAPYPQTSGTTSTLTKIATLTIGWTTGGDISPSGRQILIKQYTAMNYYQRAEGESIEDVLTNSPSSVPYTSEPQGEAVGWQGQEKGYYTLSEGSYQPIYYYTSSDSDGDGLVDSREVAESTDMNDADSDDDGQSDGDEVAAGVSPTNAGSLFAIDSASSTGLVAVIEWYARTNRLYDLERLVGPITNGAQFEVVQSNISVSADQTITTNLPLSADVQQYRVLVRDGSGW